MKLKKTKSVKTWLVHKFGGLMREEIPDLIVQVNREMQIEELSVIAEFDNANPLTNMDMNQSVKKDLAKQIGKEMMRNGVIRFSNESMPPDHYIIRAKAKVVIPKLDWW